MPVIEFQGQSYHLEEKENLLSGLLKHNARAPFSCRTGVCHSCLLKVSAGHFPKDGQQLLTQEQAQNGYVLACQATVSNDLSLKIPERDEVPGIISELFELSPTKLLLTISVRHPISAKENDSVYIINHEGDGGHYQLTAISEGSLTLECIIERQVGGTPFSKWVHTLAEAGSRLMVIRQS